MSMKMYMYNIACIDRFSYVYCGQAWKNGYDIAFGKGAAVGHLSMMMALRKQWNVGVIFECVMLG